MTTQESSKHLAVVLPVGESEPLRPNQMDRSSFPGKVHLVSAGVKARPETWSPGLLAS